MQLSVLSWAFNLAMVTPPGSRSLAKSLKMSLRKLTYFIFFFACSLVLISLPGVLLEVCDQRKPKKLRKVDSLLESGQTHHGQFCLLFSL